MYPILLKIGPLTIQTVSLFHSSAILLGGFWVYHYAEKEKINKEKVFDMLVLITIFSIIGARIFSILFDGGIKWYLSNPLEIFALWNGGFTFYGGFIFGIITGIWYIKKHRLNFWKLADLFAPALALGLAVGRIGCFMSGDSYGKPSNLPWAVTFTNVHSMAPLNVPLHPTQIYSVITNSLILIVLLWWKKKQKFTGELFLLFAILYSITRSFVEIFRNDPRGVYFGGIISTSQIISLFVILLSGFFYLRFKKNKIEDHHHWNI